VDKVIGAALKINSFKYLISHMQNFFGKDFVNISYDKVNHVIVLKWIISPTSDEYRETLNSLVSAMQHFNTGKVIANTIYLGTIHPQDQQWSVTEWFQQAVKVGYSKLAIIIPDDIFTQMSVEDTMNSADSSFPFAYFDNMDGAIKWIV
jgi:hypothetical protein